MPGQDELLREALVIASPEIISSVTAITTTPGFQPQFLPGTQLLDPAFPIAYLPVVLGAVRTALTALLRDRRGVVPPQRQVIIQEVSSLVGDPGLEAILRKVISDEAAMWPVGVEHERDSALFASLLTEFVNQRPTRFQLVVDAVRAAREERIGEEPPPGNRILRPVPPEGDILARELSRPAKEFGVRLLLGFLGGSEVAGYRRLYRTLEFNEYLDIPREAFVKTLDLRTPFNPIGGSLVWVLVGVKMVHGSVGYTRPEVEGRFVASGDVPVLGRGDGWTSLGDGWTSLGRNDGWTNLGRGDGWTNLGRGDGWTSLG